MNVEAVGGPSELCARSIARTGSCVRYAASKGKGQLMLRSIRTVMLPCQYCCCLLLEHLRGCFVSLLEAWSDFALDNVCQGLGVELLVISGPACLLLLARRAWLAQSPGIAQTCDDCLTD